MLVEPEGSRDEALARAVLRLNGNVLGIACGVLCGLGLFGATIFLVLKGGEEVGPHLRLLSQYLIGYRVSFAGSLIGLAYGLVLGFVAGWLVARVYGWVVDLRNR